MFEALVLVGSLVSILLALFTYCQYKLHQKYKHLPGPEIKTIFDFYFGNIGQLGEVGKKEKLFAEKLVEWSQAYGPVIKIQFFNIVAVAINGTEHVKKACIEEDLPKNGRIYKMAGWPFGERFLGQGLVTEADKSVWRKKRALMNAAFHKSNLNDYLKSFNHQGDILMEKLRSLADGKTIVSMLTQFNRATLDVIANVAFGLNISSVNDSENKLNLYITQALTSVNELIDDPLMAFKPTKYFKVREYRNAIRKLREFAREKILSRTKEMENEDFVVNDILSLIFKTAKEDQLDLEDLVDDFITFFVAGQETTANALTFCIMELGQNPEVLQKLRDEVDQVLGARQDISNDDLNQLEYTGCVFKEALRKWPPVSAFSRQTVEDTYIGEYFIPQGTWVMVSTFMSGRNPEHFPNPEKFIPERFMNKDSNQNNVSAYTFYPFALGPRNCIGQNFAQIEGKVLLAKFIQNFDFELDPTQSFRPIECSTIRPADGCRCSLKLRSQK